MPGREEETHPDTIISFLKPIQGLWETTGISTAGSTTKHQPCSWYKQAVLLLQKSINNTKQNKNIKKMEYRYGTD